MTDAAVPLPGAPVSTRGNRVATIAIFVGLTILYAPLLVEVFQHYWREGSSSHGPVLLAGIAFGLWESRALFDWRVTRRETVAATAALIAGLAIYFVASLAGFVDLGFVSAIPILIGLLLLTGGWNAVRQLWLLEVALLFAIPLSDTTLDGIFLPAKILLTKLVVTGLGNIGMPVAYSGAVISVGFNTLLIANACTGLQSLWALISVGLLYVFFLKIHDRPTMILLLLSAPLMAILANFIRLTLLVLTSFYLGSAAAKTFHQYAAYLEILFALAMFLGLHRLILLVRPVSHAPARG